MRSEQFTAEVVVHGRPLREYPHQGETFVEGHRGSEFTIRVRNHTGGQVLAVVSVDGLSVMNGKTASSDDGGYVIPAYGHVDIPGWRLDNDKVASFFFSSLPESYAAQMDAPTNIGVVGVVVYRERPKPVFRPKIYYRGDDGLETLGGGSHSFGGGVMKSPVRSSSEGIGTGFGREAEHRVTEVSFQRDYSFPAKLVIRYDTAEGLRNRGIRLDGAHQESDRVLAANPFPGDTGCPPPPGWRGRRR